MSQRLSGLRPWHDRHEFTTQTEVSRVALGTGPFILAYFQLTRQLDSTSQTIGIHWYPDIPMHGVMCHSSVNHMHPGPVPVPMQGLWHIVPYR